MPPKKRAKPAKHRKRRASKEVHRDLYLVSPLLRGPDVKALQLQLNRLADHYQFPWHRIQTDGSYGRRTRQQAKFIATIMGLDVTRLKAIGHGRITEQVQRVIRNPEKRTEADRRREDQRRPAFVKLRRQHKDLGSAVDFMVKHKGINESPSGSNRGPYPIDECQSYFGLGGVPWCGCLTGYAIESGAGANLGDTGTWWPYAGSIREDAIYGRNGLSDINPNDVSKGCIVTFFNGGDDHVGMVRGDVSGGMIPTVEGNTSSAHQSSDGGIIETQSRGVGEVTCAVRMTIN